MNIEDRTKIWTIDFMNRSRMSRGIRKVFVSMMPLFLPKEKIESSKDQFDNASRIFEIALESIVKFHPFKIPLLAEAVGKWLTCYLKIQKNTQDDKKYFVYTQRDHAIPFIPEEDIMYAYMISQCGVFGRKMSWMTPMKELRKMLDGFLDLNYETAETFAKYQTEMPRSTNHNRIMLAGLQYLDKPTNCCPSGHIANLVYFDLVANEFLKKSMKKSAKELIESLDYSVARMNGAVLYTKQHGLTDVVFGVALAEKICKKHFGIISKELVDRWFCLRKENPLIDYEALFENYQEAKILCSQYEKVSDSVYEYLRLYGFQKISSDFDTNSHFFDTNTKELVRF